MAICQEKTRMYNNEQKEKPVSMMSVRKDFVFRLANIAMINGQFTIVEDMPVTKQVRSVSLTSQKGNKYSMYHIKIESGGFEGDLELMNRELQTIAITCPEGLANYKGVTMAFDGSKWIFVSSDMPTPTSISQRVTAPPSAIDQRDLYVEQLVKAMLNQDILRHGIPLSEVIVHVKNITGSDALELIMYAKTKGAIYEQGGLYKAA